MPLVQPCERKIPLSVLSTPSPPRRKKLKEKGMESAIGEFRLASSRLSPQVSHV